MYSSSNPIISYPITLLSQSKINHSSRNKIIDYPFFLIVYIDIKPPKKKEKKKYKVFFLKSQKAKRPIKFLFCKEEEKSIYFCELNL